MDKVFLMLLLAIFSGCGVKQKDGWTPIGEESGNVTFYAKSTANNKNGNLAKISILYDYSAEQKARGITYFSTVYEEEHDCKEKQSRQLSATRYTENMGKGLVAEANPRAMQWEPVSPGSLGERQWKFACGE